MELPCPLLMKLGNVSLPARRPHWALWGPEFLLGLYCTGTVDYIVGHVIEFNFHPFFLPLGWSSGDHWSPPILKLPRGIQKSPHCIIKTLLSLRKFQGVLMLCARNWGQRPDIFCVVLFSPNRKLISKQVGGGKKRLISHNFLFKVWLVFFFINKNLRVNSQVIQRHLAYVLIGALNFMSL